MRGSGELTSYLRINNHGALQDLILPLVECAQQALRRKDGQLTFTKATNLLEIVLKHKKVPLCN